MDRGSGQEGSHEGALRRAEAQDGRHSRKPQGTAADRRDSDLAGHAERVHLVLGLRRGGNW